MDDDNVMRERKIEMRKRGNGPNLVSTIGGRKPAGGEKRTSAMLLLVTTFSTLRNLDDEDDGA